MSEVPNTDPNHFTSPEYWDGHQLGEQNPHPPLTVPLPNTARRQGTAFAHGELKEYLGGSTFTAAEEVAEGEQFNADDHRPGSIIVVGREVARTSLAACIPRQVKGLRSNTYTTEDCPAARILGEASGREVMFTDKGVYSASSLWGVVVEDKKGENNYVRYLGPGQALRVGVGSLVRPFSRRILPASFVVGEVMGKSVPARKSGQPSPDYFQRVTRVVPTQAMMDPRQGLLRTADDIFNRILPPF